MRIPLLLIFIAGIIPVKAQPQVNYNSRLQYGIQVMGMKNPSDNFYRIVRRHPDMDSICLAVAKREFAELNRARQNPGAYGREIRIKLDHFPALPPLQWDSALSKIAQMKAEDMLRHKYFGHEDPWKRHIGWYVLRSGYPLANPFRYLEEEGTHVLESCAGNISTNPKDTQWTHHRYVKFLIYENGAPDEEASHRLHLLGKGVVLNGTAFPGHQVGIGVAPGHVVILIADREN